VSADTPAEDNAIFRRDFLGTLTKGTLISSGVLAFLGVLKFLMPAVLPTLSTTFKIGSPDHFPVDSSQVYPDRNVIVYRDDDGIYAISLVCTHLGCIVTPTSSGFSCPCHGSKFDLEGNVLAEPAPRGLSWLAVEMTPGGKLVVDTAKVVSIGTKLAV
jgi:cytochrome b6-f complex iron-sulfur subunit